MPARLTLEGGTASPPICEFTPDQVVRLGRNRKSDVVLRDQHASREHAEIFQRDRCWYLRDCGTTNGTRLNGERIVATAGMFANMPVGTPHSFKNESGQPAKMLILIAPAGLEKMFFEVGVPLELRALVSPPPSKEDIEKLVKAAARYGVEIKSSG